MPKAISNKRLIQKSCRELLQDPEASPSVKVKAIITLERMGRISIQERRLSALLKKKKGQSGNFQAPTSMEAILEAAVQ